VLSGELDHLVVLAVDDAVAVLDLGDADQLERPLHDRLVDVREPNQVELALTAQLFELAQLIFRRDGLALFGVDQAQIDEVQALRPQRLEVGLHTCPQLVGALCGQDRPRRVAPLPWSPASTSQDMDAAPRESGR
jgi:hypothetical protein